MRKVCAIGTFLCAAIWSVGVNAAEPEGASAAAPAASTAPAAAEPEAEAAASDWTFTGGTVLNSKYVWRGINLVNAPVVQPYATIGYKGFAFSMWGNLETWHANRYAKHGRATGKFTEVDLTLSYSWQWEPFILSVGVIDYIFPNTGANSTAEVYGSVGLDVPLTPTITVYQDVDEAEGTYVTLGVSHVFEDICRPTANTSMNAKLAASVGYGSSKHNSFYYGADKAGFTDLTLSASFPIKLSDHWTLTPSLNYSRLLDQEIRDSMSHDDNIWAGIGLECSF